MSKLVLNGDTSGSVTLDAPAVSGTTTLTLPTTSGTIIASDSSGNVGIGTTSPQAPLHIKGYQYLEDGGGNLVMFSNGTGGSIIFRKGTASSYTDIFYTDASGNFFANSGYGSAGAAYFCRAWVNFNGAANTNLSGTYSQTGTTVTVTATAHELITGNVVYLDITSGTAVDGTYTVTVTGVNTFTVTQASRTTSGNVTLIRSTIRGSANVSSVSDLGVGIYRVNLINAMPDTNGAVMSGGAFNVPLQNDINSINSAIESTTTISVNSFNPNTGAEHDATYINVSIFR